MMLYHGIKQFFLIFILAILVSIEPLSFACAAEKDFDLFTLVEKYDSVLNVLVASENFLSNLACRNEKIHLPIETRIPQGGVVAVEDIYGIAGDITEPRGGGVFNRFSR